MTIILLRMYGASAMKGLGSASRAGLYYCGPTSRRLTDLVHHVSVNALLDGGPRPNQLGTWDK